MMSVTAQIFQVDDVNNSKTLQFNDVTAETFHVDDVSDSRNP